MHTTNGSSAVLLAGHVRVPHTPPLPPCPRSLTFFFTLNALSNYDPYQRWRIRLESVARRLGIADDLTSPDQWEGEG